MNFKNRFSGDEITLGWLSKEERSLWLLRKRLKDFERCVYGEGLHVSFLTVTQSDKKLAESYKWISQIMQAMNKQIKRSGAKMFYVAVLEIQPKRYRERGVLAPHWHVAIGCTKAGLLPHAKRLESGHIAKVRNGEVITWDWLLQNVKQKFGLYFCCDAYSRNIYNYLGKYLAKGDELADFRLRLGRRVRLFSSSRMKLDYQMTIGQAAERCLLISDIAELDELYWHREGSKIIARAKEVINISPTYKKVRYPKVMCILGDWVPIDDVAPSAAVDTGEQTEPQ